MQVRAWEGRKQSFLCPLHSAGFFSEYLSIGAYILSASQENLRGFREEKEDDSMARYFSSTLTIIPNSAALIVHTDRVRPTMYYSLCWGSQ